MVTWKGVCLVLMLAKKDMREGTERKDGALDSGCIGGPAYGRGGMLRG